MRKLILLCLGVLLLAGCPPADDGGGTEQAAEHDELDTYAALLQSEDGVRDELKRLQAHCTDSARDSAWVEGANYTLSVEATDGAVDIVLEGTGSEDSWRLRGWTPDPESETPITIIKSESTTGGYYFEANIGPLILSMQLRWLPGGALQVSRSLLLGGLELTRSFKQGNCDWILSGPWLPYRVLPQSDGPWGIVPAADGTWNSGTYPGACRLPAIAAYDPQQGWLLAVADEHARLVDRRYELGWRVSPGYVAGELARISVGYFDSTKDEFMPGYLASGLEQRDSVVLMPITITGHSVDPTSVEASTTQVVHALSRYVRLLHYTPRPPALQVRGSVVLLMDWLGSEDEPEPTQELDRLSATAGVRYALVSADEFKKGVLTDELVDSLSAIQVMPVVESPLAKEWFNASELRDASLAAGLLRQAAVGPGFASAGMYWLMPGFTQAEHGSATGGFNTCTAMHEVTLELKAAEYLHGSHPGDLLFGFGSPCLCLPPHMNGYIVHVPASALSQPEESHESMQLFNPLAARMDNLLTAEVFGASHIVASPDSTLAGLVLAATGHQAGFLFTDEVRQYAGFEVFCKGTESLTWIGQELLTLYSNPVACTYSLEGERPAQCRELVAINTAQTDLASAIWVVFEGVGGSVAVDNHNVLTVTWVESEPKKTWTTTLPVGYWEVEHPSPLDVQPGDAVLVFKGTITPAGPGSSAIL